MVRIDKIIKICPGGLHCWVETPIGKIRKPCQEIPQELWDVFEGKKPAPTLKAENIKEEIKPLPKIKQYNPFEIKWYKKLWFILKRIFWKIFSMKR